MSAKRIAAVLFGAFLGFLAYRIHADGNGDIKTYGVIGLGMFITLGYAIAGKVPRIVYSIPRSIFAPGSPVITEPDDSRNLPYKYVLPRVAHPFHGCVRQHKRP